MTASAVPTAARSSDDEAAEVDDADDAAAPLWAERGGGGGGGERPLQLLGIVRCSRRLLGRTAALLSLLLLLSAALMRAGGQGRSLLPIPTAAPPSPPGTIGSADLRASPLSTSSTPDCAPPSVPSAGPSGLRFGPLNLSSWADPLAVDSSREVQLGAAAQVRFDAQVMAVQGVRLSVVLFALLNASSPHDWRPLVRLMVQEQLSWRLPHSADMHYVLQAVHATSHTAQGSQAALDECEDLIRSLLAAAQPPLSRALLEAVEVRASISNAFEYPAISRVWNIARHSAHSPSDRHIILYYHTKVHTHIPHHTPHALHRLSSPD